MSSKKTTISLSQALAKIDAVIKKKKCGAVPACVEVLKSHNVKYKAQNGKEQFYAVRGLEKKYHEHKTGVDKITTTSGTSHDELKEGIKKALKKKDVFTLEELSDTFNVGVSRVREAVSELKKHGHNIKLDGATVVFSNLIAKASDTILDVKKMTTGLYKFGAIGDNHMGSNYERLDVLDAMYDLYAKEGITTVYNTGNWIDGEARFNKTDIHKFGMDDQVNYFVERYPKRKGITTYFISGDDHEGWYCFDGNTQIFTKNGWKYFSEISNDEIVATQTDDGVFEYNKINKKISYYHDGEMISMKSRSLDFSVTPDHRFFVNKKQSLHAESKKEIVTANDIFNNFKSRCYGIVCSTENWIGSTPSDVIKFDQLPSEKFGNNIVNHIDSISIENMVKLIGWYVTEGSCYGRCISISQSKFKNQKNYDDIKNLLQEIGVKTITLSDKDLRFSAGNVAKYLEDNCGKGSFNKKLPTWIKNLPKKLLQILFNVMIEGDGSFKKGGGFRFYSWSESLRSDMIEICQKLGYGVIENEKYNSLSIRSSFVDPWIVKKPIVEKYAGYVFCVNVKNSKILVKRNGKIYWSMNCQREGINIGHYAQMKAEAAGRKDLIHLGYMEHDIILPAKKGQTKLRVLHPGGGSAYAMSYAPQKIVESYQGGEKPDVLLIGHYHKSGYNFIRGVHTVQTGTTMDQSPFMRKKRLAAHVGGCIIEFGTDDVGAVTRFKHEFIPFYDNQYYKDWNYLW